MSCPMVRPPHSPTRCSSKPCRTACRSDLGLEPAGRLEAKRGPTQAGVATGRYALAQPSPRQAENCPEVFMSQGIAPMLAVPGTPFDSPEFVFEVKWNGVRAL